MAYLKRIKISSDNILLTSRNEAISSIRRLESINSDKRSEAKITNDKIIQSPTHTQTIKYVCCLFYTSDAAAD